jgi:ribosomal protein S15P/S13E
MPTVAEILALTGKKSTRKKGKKGRKIGRCKRHPAAARYTGEKRWTTNRIKRIRRHLKKYPNDVQAKAALET